MKSVPRNGKFTHDCGPDHGCHYLGKMDTPDGWFTDPPPQVDLWVHLYPNGNDFAGDSASLIYRYGNDGPEYGSLPPSAMFSLMVNGQHAEPYKECFRRAIDQGLLNLDDYSWTLRAALQPLTGNMPQGTDPELLGVNPS